MIIEVQLWTTTSISPAHVQIDIMVLNRQKTLVSLLCSKWSRHFAQVVPGFTIREANPPAGISPLDRYLFEKAEQLNINGNRAVNLLQQYDRRRGHELKTVLQAESRPSRERAVQVDSTTCPIFLIAHVAKSGDDKKICISSGFRLQTDGSPVLITCAHTLEEIQFSSILSLENTTSTTCILSDNGCVWQVAEIVSSLPRHDLLLLQTDDSTLFEHQSLPVSPYPASVNTTVAAHFVTETKPNEDGWTPCFNGTLFRKWVTGTVIGYKDFAGNEAKPGTYDSLPHMFFTQVPTPGSSGGPVIDLDTGAVIGLIRGSQLDNRLSGLRGWGTSAESIYEMFTLPGIHRS